MLPAQCSGWIEVAVLCDQRMRVPVQDRLTSLRASLGMTDGPDAGTASLHVSSADRQLTSGPAGGGTTASFLVDGVCDLLHLLLHSLDQLAEAHDEGSGQRSSGSQSATAAAAVDELQAARFTVQTLLEELAACAAAQNALAAPASHGEPAEGGRAECIQHKDAGTAPEAFSQQTDEQGTQTAVDPQWVHVAQAAQTDVPLSSAAGMDVQQQRARAEKWKARCKQLQADVTAAQAAAAEGTAPSHAHDAAQGSRLAKAVAAHALPAADPASATIQQESMPQQCSAEPSLHEACARQLQPAVSISDSLAATDLRAATATQLTDADGERRTLRDQAAAAESARRAAEDEAKQLGSRLEVAQDQHATLDAALHAERDRAAALDASLQAETDRVAALEEGLHSERARLERARTAVLNTVDALRKASEGSTGRAQLEALAQRVNALEAALRRAHEKLARRRKQAHALRESHADAMAGMQQRAYAADAMVSELRMQLAEAVKRHEVSQHQQDAAGAEISEMRALFEEAAQRHERTQQELALATDALTATANAATGAVLSDEASGGAASVPTAAAVTAAAKHAERAVGKLISRCSTLEATLRLVERDRDRAQSQALEIHEVARHAQQESQTARASETSALAACEALELSIQQLRRQHELECLALGKKHMAEIQGLEAAMLNSRVALKQRDAENAADAMAGAEAAAAAIRVHELAALRQQHDAELTGCRAQHAGQVGELEAQLAAAEAARDSVRERFDKYQAQKAQEVAALEGRLRAAMRQPLATRPLPPPVSSRSSAAMKAQAGLARRPAKAVSRKHGRAAKPARRAPLRLANAQQENILLQQTSAKPEQSVADSDPAGYIRAVMDSDASIAAAREVSLEQAQREAAEAALAQSTVAVDTLREQMRAVQRDLAACQRRVVQADGAAATARGLESSARRECLQLQVCRMCAGQEPI